MPRGESTSRVSRAWSFPEKTAARWDEYELEQKIRANMRSRISSNARHRQEEIRRLAEEPIIEFFDQYVLEKSPHLDASLPRRVVWSRNDSLAENSDSPLRASPLFPGSP